MATVFALLTVLGAEEVDRTEIDFFEKRIRPVLVQHCYKCHSARAKELGGNLRLDTREGIRRGGATGPAITPSSVEESLLVSAIRHESLEMPPDRRLPDRVIADFVRWVEMGALDPRESTAADGGDNSWPARLAAQSNHWSLRPVSSPPLPTVRRVGWSSHPIDRFILAALEAAGLRPAPPTDRRSLMRRLSFALTGLPPNPQEIEAFVIDPSIGAVESLVDRLLASPHFGERWARHWMDVVRFSETHGHEWNFEVRGAWRYRDYLIRALNQDVPYDQLVREHIAGDLLSEPRWNETDAINESLIGTAFYRFGEVGHDNCLEFREISLDVIDNQIDTMTKAFQATTVTCARCHDHKLDPISMRDYYALSGILSSSRNVALTLDAPSVHDHLKQELKEVKSQIRAALSAQWSQDVTTVGRYLQAAQLRCRTTPTSSASPSSNSRQENETVLREDLLANWVASLHALDDQEPGLEHPLYLWWAMEACDSAGSEISTAWHQLVSQYETEQRQRSEFNRQRFRQFGAFGKDSRKGQVADTDWHRAGLGLAEACSPSGDFAVIHEGDQVVRSVFPEGTYTHRSTSRLNGALRSPFLPKNKKYISVQVLGRGQSALRMIYDDCHLGVNIELLDSDEPRWITKPTSHEYADSNVYAALVTKFDNQSFPKYNTQEQIDPADIHSYFGVTRAVLHDCEEPPRDALTHIMPLLGQGSVDSLSQLADRYERRITAAVAAWTVDQATDHDVRWINWLLTHKLISNSAKASHELAELVRRYREMESRIPPPKLVNGLSDLDRGFDVPLKVRGNPFELGETVPRRYLEVLSGSTKAFATGGSGRRQLAEVIASRSNPLTARVMVNRVWHYLFGTGIVKTTDDFGSIGDRPSHPELLDYLSSQFVAHDWSVKQLIRSIVLTQTYRMSSRSSVSAAELDPANRLLEHFPLRRLEAEAIRDAILASSARLDHRLYGRSIHPHRLEERKDRRLFSGPLDSHGRRSLYTKVTLTEEPPLLTLFNFPEPKVTRGRRDVTSVPAQALALLNDPFVNQQAAVWAQQLIARESQTLATRIEEIFLTALARPPSPAETRRFRLLTEQLAELYKVPTDDLLVSELIWKDVAHAMFNLKEFIYLR